MNEIQKRLDHAFQLLGRMSVSGDVVDVMYAVRKELREAYKLAGDKSALWEAHKLAEKSKAEEAENG